MSQGWTGILLPAAIVAAVGVSPLRPISLRDTGLVMMGIVMGIVFAAAIAKKATTVPNRWKRGKNKQDQEQGNQQDHHIVQTIEELRKLMPAGASGTCLEDARKVLGHLDDQMTEFVSRSPLLYLATFDSATDAPFVSPKGDEPGFVTVLSNPTDAGHRHRHTLVIPERPGNRLLFGLQNIVGRDESGTGTETKTETQTAEYKTTEPKQPQPARVSLLFEVPGTASTLRCGGTARLSTDPALLYDHSARGCPPKLVILVDVDHAFFHCAKAYLRARVWDPSSWPSETEAPRVTFGRYFAKKGSYLANRIDSDIDQHYRQVQKAIDGEACETEP